jgi:periplasmic divalent cation tolerance protein
MTEALLVYVTTETREDALSLGRACVEARLAACANVIDGMHSIYRWQGAVEEATEAVLLLKTQKSCLDALTDLIRERHAYDCPCVVAVPIVGGNAEYLTWIAESCG